MPATGWDHASGRVDMTNTHQVPLHAPHAQEATTLQQRFNDWADGQQIGDRSDGCGESPDGREDDDESPL